ncbi:hypothetical protein N431DRAFT_457276 [Stipitochalara longipes BDJ]|nr:hypothetical protein N431DRAFT_457276 [Stipitochalara longipes BDJ]
MPKQRLGLKYTQNCQNCVLLSTGHLHFKSSNLRAAPLFQLQAVDDNMNQFGPQSEIPAAIDRTNIVLSRDRQTPRQLTGARVPEMLHLATSRIFWTTPSQAVLEALMQKRQGRIQAKPCGVSAKSPLASVLAVLHGIIYTQIWDECKTGQEALYLCQSCKDASMFGTRRFDIGLGGRRTPKSRPVIR